MTILQDHLDEYAKEYCDWDDIDYLVMCGYRYGNVSDPSHLHCLAYVMALKLIELSDERQKWIRVCMEFGAGDEGTTANLIMQKGAV